MTWPADPLPVAVEMWTGSWQDITNKVFARDGGITIRRGFPDEGSTPEPSSCTLTLDNRTGDFTPRNPMGQYYGKIGRNTPVRVSVALYEDDFDRTVADGWGDDWTLVTTGGAAGDFDVAGGVGTIVVDGANEARAAYLTSRSFSNAEVRVTLDIADLDITGAGVGGGPILRVTDGDNLYWCLASVGTDEAVTLTIFERTGGVNTQLATASTGITWDGTPLVVAFSARGETLRAKAWSADENEPGDWLLETTDTSFTSGSAGVRAAVLSGNTDTPVTFSVDDFEVRSYRFVGEISEWPPRWDVSGQDVWTSVTAQGILRRLGQGASPKWSALRRLLPSTNPDAYWPLEEHSDATRFASPITGCPPLTFTAADHLIPGGYGQTPGSAPIASWDSYRNDGTVAGWILDGSAKGAVPSMSQGTIAVGLIFAGDTGKPAATTLVEFDLNGGGNYTVLRIGVYSSTIDGVLSDSYGIEAVLIDNVSETSQTVGFDTTDAGSGPQPFDGQPHAILLTLVQDGSDVDMTLVVDDHTAYTATATSVTLGVPTIVRVGGVLTYVSLGGSEDVGDGQLFSVSVGHVAVWDSVPSVDIYEAMQAYAGETAADRADRLCDQHGVPFELVGTAADSMSMGKQAADATFVEALDETWAADMGLLFETRDEAGITLRTRRSLYNQSVALTLDYTGAGEIAPDLEPTDDDQRTRNDIEVKRKGGSSARATDTTSRLGSQDPPSGVGPYSHTAELNLAEDSVLSNVASWLLHVHTWDEPRVRAANIYLHALAAAGKHDQVAQAAQLDVGDRFQLTNLPAHSGYVGTADLMALGFVEQIEHPVAWTITLV